MTDVSKEILPTDELKKLAERCEAESHRIFPRRMRDGHSYHQTAFILDKAAAALSAIPVSGEVERLREALEKIADRAAKLRKGTDDWFELAEFENIAREALAPPRSIRVSDLTDEEVEEMRKPSA